MKAQALPVFLFSLLLAAPACAPAPEAGSDNPSAASVSGQLAVDESGSTPSIARIASDSKDHTTLVAALKAVNWLDALANPGPFTVFAPVNAAFDALPAGTVENLLKPENAAQLRGILLHHVLVSAYNPEDLVDGMSLGMLEGGPTTVTRTGDQIVVDGAKVVGQVRAGNGWVYVLDAVLLPK